MTADLRREEIARPLTPDEETLVRDFYERRTTRLAMGPSVLIPRLLATLDEARSQDTATARIAELEGAISNYIVTVTRAAHRPDHPNFRTAEQVEARYRELLDALNDREARAVLSGETRTDGEPVE